MKSTTETRVLQAAHMGGSTVLVLALAHADVPWWAWVVVLLWGLLTGVWAHSAGWDAAFAHLRELGEKR